MAGVVWAAVILLAGLTAVSAHTNTECFYDVLHQRAGQLPAAKLEQRTKLPDVSVLGASYVWPEGKVANKSLFYPPNNLTEISGMDGCGCIYRYKIVKGKLYTDPDTSALVAEKHCTTNIIRPITQEMLLMAMWAYDLPDMDIAVIGKERHYCRNFSFPFLVYAVSPDDHGVGIPLFNTWQHLAGSTEQLKAQRDCLVRGAEGKKQNPVVFWRGSSTGLESVWRNGTQRTREMSSRDGKRMIAPSLLLKRVHAVLMMAPFDFADVKLSTLARLPNYDRIQTESLTKELTMALISQTTGSVPMHMWSTYAITLSLDGYGPAFREPVQMLGKSVILRTDSPFHLWYHQLIKPGVHMEFFDYDNLDLLTRSKELIDEFTQGSARLESQVEELGKFALEQFTLAGQLRSFVWALLKAQALSPWDPEPDTDGWTLVKKERERWWNPFIADEVREAIMKDMPDNFLAA